jgi:hypothetical protein
MHADPSDLHSFHRGVESQEKRFWGALDIFGGYSKIADGSGLPQKCRTGQRIHSRV